MCIRDSVHPVLRAGGRRAHPLVVQDVRARVEHIALAHLPHGAVVEHPPLPLAPRAAGRRAGAD
eukprot:2884006-Prymnesium_polylepis.1